MERSGGQTSPHAEALKHSSVGFASIDPRDARLTWVNAAAASFLAREPASLVGAVLWDALPEPMTRPLRGGFPAPGVVLRVEAFEWPDGRWTEASWIAAADALVLELHDVTAHHHLEETFQKHLDSLAGHLDAVVWRLDPGSGRVSYVSPNVDALFAETPSTPSDWLAAVHEDDRNTVATVRMSGAEDYAIEYRVVRPNDEPRWVRERASPVRDHAGRVHVFGVSHDVTTERVLEDKLRLQRRAYGVLVSVGALLARFDEPAVLLREVVRIVVEEGGIRLAWVGRVDEATGELVAIASHGQTAFLEGIAISSLAHKAEGNGPSGRAAREGLAFSEFDRDPNMAPWRERAARFGLRSSASASFRLPDGARAVLTLYAGESGVFGQEDPLITQLVRSLETGMRAHGASRRAELLARVVEQSETLVAVTDVDGVFRYINRAFAERTGWTAEELVGKLTPEILRSSKTSKGVYRNLWTTVRAGRSWSGSMHNATRSGDSFEAETKMSPLLDEHGVTIGYVGTQEDVSERNRMRARLERAQRLESLGLLAGGIAHDFNNILGAMMMYGQTLLTGLAEGSEAHADALEIVHGTERAAALTKQLLAFSRKQIFEATDYDLVHQANDLAKMLRKLIGPAIQLSIVARRGSVRVHADQGQIDHVLINLCVNARDAMPDGGRLDLVLDHVQLGPDEAASVGVSPGVYGCISVVDEGVGMTPELVERIFEPFFTTKAGRGTGLGLATCFGIVTQSRGNIVVRSKPGQGSTFEVLLPAASGVTLPPPARQREASEHHANVLLVDDESNMRRVLERVLQRAGYRVWAAADGMEAWEQHGARVDEIDLVVADVAMPRMSGTTLLERLRRGRPQLPALLITGLPIKDLNLDQQAHTRILQKPFAPAQLLGLVEEFLVEVSRDPRRVPASETRAGREDG